MAMVCERQSGIFDRILAAFFTLTLFISLVPGNALAAVIDADAGEDSAVIVGQASDDSAPADDGGGTSPNEASDSSQTAADAVVQQDADESILQQLSSQELAGAEATLASATPEGTALTAQAEGDTSFVFAFPSASISTVDLYGKAIYNDAYFANPSSEFNTNLAYASTCLALSTFNSNMYDEDYYRKSVNIRSFLQDVGCENIEVNGGYQAKPMDKAPVGVAIGSKDISVNSQPVKLIVVGVRGGNYLKEWVGNLRVGDGDSTSNHEGFEQARDEVVARIYDYVTKHTDPRDHVKIWMSGYSRSGAVTNMTAGFLCENLVSENADDPAEKNSHVYGKGYDPVRLRNTESMDVTFWGRYITKDDVYCYPVNAPMGVMKNRADATRDVCTGIHNIINPDDWIPQVAPAEWGFARYGTDHDVTSNFKVLDAQRSTKISMDAPTMESMKSRLKTLDPKNTWVHPRFLQHYFSVGRTVSVGVLKGLFFSLAKIPAAIVELAGITPDMVKISDDKNGEGNFYINKGQSLNYNQGRYYTEFIEFFIDALGVDRASFAHTYQGTFEFLVGSLMGATNKQFAKLNAAVDKNVSKYVPGKLKILLYLSDYVGENNAKLKTMLKNLLTGVFGDVGIAYDSKQMDKAIVDLAEIVHKLWEKENSFGKYKFYHLTTLILNAGAVAQGHWPEVAIAHQKLCKPGVASEFSGNLQASGEELGDMAIVAQDSQTSPDEHKVHVLLDGGVYVNYVTRTTGDILGVMPVPDKIAGTGNIVVDSWDLLDYNDDTPIARNVGPDYVIKSTDPQEIKVQGHWREIQKKQVCLYANNSGDYSKKDLIAQFEVNEDGELHITNDSEYTNTHASNIVGYYVTPVLQGFSFDGWATAPNAEGDSVFYYADDEVYWESIEGESLDLYAQWIDPLIWEVDYHPNGGIPDKVVEEFDDAEGDVIELSENTFTREGYTFVGWSTTPDGKGKLFAPGTKVSLADLNLTPRDEYRTRVFTLNEDNPEDVAKADQWAEEGTAHLYAQWKRPGEDAPVWPTYTRNSSGGSGTYGTVSTSCSRLAGANRYATMASIASEGFSSSGRVILASGESFPDALCASALAGSWDCPVILTSRDSLSPEAKAEIERLGAGDVVIFGGEAAVSAGVEAEIVAMGRYVERMAGADRAATSVLALQRLVAGGMASDTVVVATGATYADALSIGPWSWATKSPIVLLSGGALSDDAVAAIHEGGFSKAIIIGGEGSVPASVEAQLAGLAITRLSGADRYATSVAVATFAAGNGLSWSPVFVVSGESFPDALAGAPLVGKRGGVLLLTRDGSTAATDAVASHASAISQGYVLGGEASVSAATLSALENAMN